MSATTSERPQVDVTAGGRELGPALPDLTPAQELALLARMLFREGYDDHLSGHITYKQADGTFLCNPFGMTWDELRASDVMHMDAEGNLLDGRWTITPAITLHVELHRARHDVGVAVHNHPRWSTIWSDLHRVPPFYDQTGAMYSGEVALFDDYQGSVDQVDNARTAVAAVGSADVALLANHGVLVLGQTPAMAFLRASSFEWRCRQAWHVEAVGGGKPMRPEVVTEFGSYFTANPFPGLFEAMARRELRADPSVLD
jgi:ribulose-5-phosphate 4-epimerase/fuculose-1-phosphate aldolase